MREDAVDTAGSAGPPAGPTAWADARTRRALGLYALRSAGWLVVAVVSTLVAGLFLGADGEAKNGVPGIVPGAIIMAAIFAVLLGAFGMLRAAQMAWVAARHAWVEVDAGYEAIAMSTPNGQPVLRLSHDSQTWTLTLAALVWRWKRFGDARTLLLAARPGRGGMVATTDRRNVAWAGRSLATKFLLWRQGRRSR